MSTFSGTTSCGYWLTPLWLCLVACGGESAPASVSVAPGEPTVDTQQEAQRAERRETPDAGETGQEPAGVEHLPMPFRVIWEPWLGDFDGMVERRLIRAVAPYGGYQFFYEDGLPRGATYDLLQRLEDHINKEHGRGNIKIYVVVIPVSRDELVPALLNGHADLVAGDLTTTSERSELVTFARPMLTNINEVVVTGPGAPPLESLEDLAGQRIVIRASSSYFEHLQTLAPTFREKGLDPPKVVPADEILEAEDMLEMVSGGMIPITVMDDYKAQFWEAVFPDIVVRHDLVINEGGSIAWAMRNDSPKLEATIEGFLKKYGKGTLVGNDTYNRYLSNAARVRCSHTPSAQEEVRALADVFRKYGELYDFNWLMLAAQAYQESGLRQDRRSSAGAVGIMQIKPSTAADKNVGIDDVTTVDANIHAGAKYMRFLADRYFSDEEIDDLNRWIFSLAAYNAGPARIAGLRREAAENSYDRNRWFNNVEIIAARRIGRESVAYVSNIFKYFVGYQLTMERGVTRSDRYGDKLQDCVARAADPGGLSKRST